MLLASLALAAATSLAFMTNDAAFAFQSAREFAKDCTPRDAGTLRGRLAANWLMDRVSRTGADASIDVFRAPVPDGGEDTFRNVLVEFPAQTADASWIVIVSHFDTVPHIGAGFEGANDGASTSGLLIALARILRQAGRQKFNIACAWTDAEECRVAYTENDGLQGAKQLVSCFKARKRNVEAVIGIDMLGDRNLNLMLPSNCTPRLKRAVHEAARRIGAPALVKDDDREMKDDYAVFFDAGYSAVNLIDFEYGSAPGRNDYWHTPEDKMDKISESSLFTSGRLVVELLNILQGT